jgi:hypothetical protein
LIATFGAGYCAGGDFWLLVNKTLELLSSPSLSEQMGSGAERMLEEWFDNQRNTDAFLEGLT